MKNLIILLITVMCATILTSCNKNEDSNTPTPVVYPNYSEFNVGSYWVYRQYDIDISGNATPTNVIDSCYVVKDTVLNKYTYSKIYKPSELYSDYIYTRDSLHFVVAYGGQILFSSQDYQTIFKSRYQMMPPDNDTICKIVMKMADKDSSIVVPAGTFITSNFQVTYNMYPKFSFYGSSRKMNTRYAENIGIVTETLQISLGNPNYIERRLVRYHIQ